MRLKQRFQAVLFVIAGCVVAGGVLTGCPKEYPGDPGRAGESDGGGGGRASRAAASPAPGDTPAKPAGRVSEGR